MKHLSFLSAFFFVLSFATEADAFGLQDTTLTKHSGMNKRFSLHKSRRFMDTVESARGSAPISDEVRWISSGLDHNCVSISTNGAGIKCWGSNGSGQLGYGDTQTRGDEADEMGDNLPFVNLGKNIWLKALSLGGYHSCATAESNKVKCWGDNRYGQLALGDTNNRGDQPNEMGDKLPFINFGNGRIVKAILTGLAHTCAFFNDNKVACFGNNEHGQLGLGDTNNRGGSLSDLGANIAFVNLPAFSDSEMDNIHTSSSANHTCISLLKGSLCWGSNSNGQLGLGDTNNRGDQPNEMGANLTLGRMPDGDRLFVVFVGGANTCFLTDKQKLYCVGDNKYGQLGVGHKNTVGDGPKEMGNNLKALALGTAIVPITASIGVDHICVIVQPEPYLKCYGNNAYGQLGQGDKVNRGGTASTIGDYVPLVNVSSTAAAISGYQLGAGRQRNCFVLEGNGKQNTMKCFGSGANGSLGYGDTNNRGDDKNEMGDYLPRVYLRYMPPTKSPSLAPTFKPTKQPTRKPSKKPTEYPTRKPTKAPTQKPTKKTQ